MMLMLESETLTHKFPHATHEFKKFKPDQRTVKATSRNTTRKSTDVMAELKTGKTNTTDTQSVIFKADLEKLIKKLPLTLLKLIDIFPCILNSKTIKTNSSS